MYDIQGSPPRMRGKHKNRRYRPKEGRITPADAGKTNPDTYEPTGGRDHPRGCGENLPPER